MDSAPTGYDLTRTCPMAKWHIGDQRAHFGIPGLPICGVIHNDEPDAIAFGWNYAVHCPVFELHRRGRRDDRASCLTEARNWLEALGCPGQVQIAAVPH